MQASTALPQKCLGLIKLDTYFPRLPGDLGLPSSWGPHVKEFVVKGALPNEIVKQQKSFEQSQFANAFKLAVKELTQTGATAITTSCGFLVLWQKELQALTHVPVVSSSLCLLPSLLKTEKMVGVLSIDANSLTPMHWFGAGLTSNQVSQLVVSGLDPDSHFCQSILGNRGHLDARLAQQEVVGAALQLKRSAANIQTLILECTNLPPYQEAIAQATGLKVLSLRDIPVLLNAANP
jgi:aspartate/glutamate racemase